MKSKKGFTLVELLIGLALFGIIITTGTSILLFGMKAHAKTVDEYEIQANTRLISQKINSTIRDSAATFLLHRDDGDRENKETFTKGWNYVVLSDDNTKLLEYIWDEDSDDFIKREVVSALNGVEFGLTYNKINAPNVDKLLEFILIVNTNGQTRTIESEIEGLNSLQIVDRAYGLVANTLAYRQDTKLSEVSNSQAVVSMVLDQSGSMGNRMNGSNNANDSSSNTSYHSRMKKLKAEATRFVNELAKLPNIYISINPFSSTGNNSKEMLKAQVNNTANNDLLSYISGLNASGGTNTGDGIRRGYYRIVEFNEEEENKNKTNKNFMIILVDGVTTFASVRETNDIVSTAVDKGTTYSYNGYNYVRNNPTSKTTTTNTDQGDTYSYNGYDYSKYNTSYDEIWTDRDRGPIYRYDRKDYIYDRTTGSGSSRRYYYRYYTYSYRTYLYIYKGVKPEDYITGNSSIENNQASDDTFYTNGRYAGKGNALDPWGKEYVDIIGKMVKDYKKGTNEAVKVYVIGFSSDEDDYGSLKDIALATSGLAEYYEAGDEAALEAIFKAIQKDISDALWHIGGPN